MLTSDLPAGTCFTNDGSFSVVTCSSSSTHQVIFEMSMPYSF